MTPDLRRASLVLLLATMSTPALAADSFDLILRRGTINDGSGKASGDNGVASTPVNPAPSIGR